MKMIPLSRGLHAKVDPQDYEALSRHRWMAKPFTTKRQGYYACRKDQGTTVYLHRQIMSPAAGMVVDHIDGDGLNNCRSNLRVVTKADNAMNSAGRSASGFRGVYYSPDRGKWRAYVTRPTGGRMWLGGFETAEEAAQAYDQAVIRLRGPIARTNLGGAA